MPSLPRLPPVLSLKYLKLWALEALTVKDSMNIGLLFDPGLGQ